MKAALIACQVIEQELKKVLQDTKREMPSVFLKPGLDNEPKVLKNAILEEISKLKDIDTIILGYGFSNGALSDFPTGKYTIVAPQAEDVICLAIGSQKRRDELFAETTSYFITEGWLKGDDLFSEYEKSIIRYGEKKAATLHKIMLGHYSRYLLIDTGVYDVDAYFEKFTEFAKKSGLKVEKTKGDLKWLQDLVNGPPWDKRFVVAKPGELLSIDPTLTSEN